MDQDEVEGIPDSSGYRVEAKSALKNWRKLVVDWRKEFPAAHLPHAPTPLWPTREFHEIHSKICREETNGEISLKFAVREEIR